MSASSGIFVYLVSFAKNIFIPYFCFLKDSFIFMYTYECLCACMSVHYLHACCFLEPEESNRSPGAGSCHVKYILVTEPGSSSRAASALNYLAISPASEFSFLIFFLLFVFLTHPLELSTDFSYLDSTWKLQDSSYVHSIWVYCLDLSSTTYSGWHVVSVLHIHIDINV